MTIVTSLILVLLILVIAVSIAYFFQMGQLSTKEWNEKITQNLVDQQAKQEIVDEMKAPQEPLENNIEVVDVEFVEKVTKISKALPKDAKINLDNLEAPKKKKKYYPRKPKTHL